MLLQPIATRAEIQAIFDRCIALLDRVNDDGNNEEDDDEADGMERYQKQVDAMDVVLEGLRFCTVAAAALGDPALGAMVIDAIELIEPYEGHADRHHHRMHTSLSALLEAGLAADARIRAMAKGENAHLRAAIARGLRPHGPAERSLLEGLASDPVAEVRKAAKKSLAAAGEVPWWAGKWKSDPVARLLPGEEEVCGPALRRISEMLDLSRYELLRDARPIAKLAAEVATLPDELAVEVIEQVCRSAEHWDTARLEPLLLMMVERRGGIDAFDRLIDFWASSLERALGHDAIAEVVRHAPPAPRRAVCDRLIARVVAAPIADRRRMHETPAWLAAAIAGKAWPPDADVTPLLDALLSIGGEDDEGERYELDFARASLSDALALEGVDPTPVLDRVAEARMAGYPVPWRGLGTSLNKLLSRAPRERLRTIAEQALHSEDAGTVQWALEMLLGAAFDRALDGDPLERVGALYAEPRLRSVLLKDDGLVDKALPVLRAELLRGALTYAEAVTVFDSVDRLYGGLAQHGTEEKAEASRAEHRAAAGELLGPPELRGPPTAEEWAALRRARAGSAPAKPGAHATLWARTLAAGPWTEEERTDLDAFFALFREQPEGPLVLPLARALETKPEPWLLPLFDELVTRCDPRAKPLIRHFRNETRKSLGIAPPPKPQKAAGAGASGAGDEDGDGWDDEEEGG